MKNEIIPVILCGGSGARLWPLSRSGFPKQFLVLSGISSLFQQAVERVNGISCADIEIGSTLVVTNEEHRFLVLDQLRELKDMEATVLLEPTGRNTAPALTLAALQATADGQDPILVVTPADQTVSNSQTFTTSLQQAVRAAASGNIVILGVKPDKPEVGYGYILQSGAEGEFGEYVVAQFAEKPNQFTAELYLANGSYSWNSGMFVLKASTWLNALKYFRPDIASSVKLAWTAKTIDKHIGAHLIRPDAVAFATVPSQSIDYAVIEHCPNSQFPIHMLTLDAGWSDLGAWDAVWQIGPHDSNGNVTQGDTLLVDSHNSLVHAGSRLVGVVGVRNLVIVETSDAVLVADRNESQEIKKLVIKLEQLQRRELNMHRKVHRPWGWYDNIDESSRFKVKRILVKPGACLSLQMHEHRAEHWIVVQGTAEVTCGDAISLLSENQSTYIPLGKKHRLRNPGNIPLEIIEVHSGSYLGEDDIVRFEDCYVCSKTS